MNVFLTVDVETYTGDYALDVHGYGKGLDYIVKVCGEHNVRATFFVEALGATRWGRGPLRKVCSLIKESGHEIQLHIHSNVATIPGLKTEEDRLWAYDGAQQRQLISTGLDILRDCAQTEIKAFRAGDLMANEATLAAMEQLDLPLGSNRDLDCKSTIRSHVNEHFPVRNDLSRRGGIIDLPISAFRSPFPMLDGRYRHLQICAVGMREMFHSLSRMAESGYLCATVLTHPHEFFRRAGETTVPRRKNCRRLRELVRFISSRPEMHPRTVSECLAMRDIPTVSPPEIKVKAHHSLLRLGSQLSDRLSTWLGT